MAHQTLLTGELRIGGAGKPAARVSYDPTTGRMLVYSPEGIEIRTRGGSGTPGQVLTVDDGGCAVWVSPPAASQSHSMPDEPPKLVVPPPVDSRLSEEVRHLSEELLRLVEETSVLEAANSAIRKQLATTSAAAAEAKAFAESTGEDVEKLTRRVKYLEASLSRPPSRGCGGAYDIVEPELESDDKL
jgi:hypothetical protein